MPRHPYSKSVFVNCPFDKNFEPIFRAVIFAILDCGFTPRPALETQDGGELRLNKIETLVQQCRLGIHDLSMVKLDINTGFPRFNMPFELGLFLGAKRYGDKGQKSKRCLIMDADPHRFLATVTDIRGLDPKSHDGKAHNAIALVRNWLDDVRGQLKRPLPGGRAITRRFNNFNGKLPELAAEIELDADDLTYQDETWLMRAWLKKERQYGGA